MSLQVKVDEKIAGVYLITPIGSISSENYPAFRNELNNVIAKKPREIILDLAQLDFINSEGLGLILYAKFKMEKENRNFALANIQPKIKSAFDFINDLSKRNIIATIDELDKYLARIQKENH